MKNSVINFHIKNNYAVLAKVHGDTMDVSFPANIIAKVKSPETSIIYKISKNSIDLESLTGDNISRARLENIPSYVVRPLVLIDMAMIAKRRNMSALLIFVVSDTYQQASFKNMVDIGISKEDQDNETYLLNNLDKIYTDSFDDLKPDLQEGCKFLFECFKNGGIAS